VPRPVVEPVRNCGEQDETGRELRIDGGGDDDRKKADRRVRHRHRVREPEPPDEPQIHTRLVAEPGFRVCYLRSA